MNTGTYPLFKSVFGAAIAFALAACGLSISAIAIESMTLLSFAGAMAILSGAMAIHSTNLQKKRAAAIARASEPDCAHVK
jgi:hypothetical protein